MLDAMITMLAKGGEEGAITESSHNRIGGGGHSCHFQKEAGPLLGLLHGRHGGVIFCNIGFPL